MDTLTKLSCWLGFLIDLFRHEITAPDDEIESLTWQLMKADTKGVCKEELLVSIVGTNIAMGLGIGPITRFMTRSMYTLLGSQASWNCFFLDLHLKHSRKLSFGLKGLGSTALQPIWYTPSSIRVVQTDASESG